MRYKLLWQSMWHPFLWLHFCMILCLPFVFCQYPVITKEEIGCASWIIPINPLRRLINKRFFRDIYNRLFVFRCLVKMDCIYFLATKPLNALCITSLSLNLFSQNSFRERRDKLTAIFTDSVSSTGGKLVQNRSVAYKAIEESYPNTLGGLKTVAGITFIVIK